MRTKQEVHAAAEKHIRFLIRDCGTLKPVSGRGLKFGDIAAVEIEIRRQAEIAEYEAEKREDVRVDTQEMAEEVNIPGAAAVLAISALVCPILHASLSPSFYVLPGI